MAAAAHALADKDFLAAQPDEQIKYLASVDKDFAGATPEDQRAYLNHIVGTANAARNAQSTEFEKQNTPKKNLGFTPANMGSQFIEGLKDTARMGKNLVTDISNEKKPLFFGSAEEGPQESTFHKYVIKPSEQEFEKARKAPSGIESVGHSIAGAIPVIGPYFAGVSEQAGTGDIGGTLARMEGQGESFKALKGLGKSALPEVGRAPEGGIQVKPPPLIKKVGDVGAAAKEATARALRNEANELRPTAKVAARVAGAAIGHSGIPVVGGILGYHEAPRVLEAIAPNRAPVPEFPGAHLPSAEEFYSKEGAERNALLRQGRIRELGEQRKAQAAEKAASKSAAEAEANKPVFPGAPLPAAEDFYANEGAERNAMLKRQGRMPTVGQPTTGETPLVESASSQAPVVRLPVPRETLPGENPKYMASIPRARLLNLGRQGRPGAGEQLRNVGRNVLYVPEEYPGPRSAANEAEMAPAGLERVGEGKGLQLGEGQDLGMGLGTQHIITQNGQRIGSVTVEPRAGGVLHVHWLGGELKDVGRGPIMRALKEAYPETKRITYDRRRVPVGASAAMTEPRSMKIE
jgi:hypothetical protein